MTDTITISISAGFIDAAMCAVSKEETRYYLKGVFIDARGFIAATNGHMAFAARCNDAYKLAGVSPTYPSDALPGVIVPDTAITQAIKAAGRSKGLTMEFSRDTLGQWWVTYGDARVNFEPVDGPFPDWQRVIPCAPKTLKPGHYNPLYIGKLGDMAKALRDGKKDAASLFKLHQNGENPALVTFASEDGLSHRTDCCGVLMPMRETGESAFDRDAFTAA
tara:strand:+ start:349 stop:1008 length:660 start_codon:yes stop_codon:yes gene_type:complete